MLLQPEEHILLLLLFWLHWVLVAACRILLHHAGYFLAAHEHSSCSAQIYLPHCMWEFSFPDQGSNPCPLHRKTDS